MHPLGNDRFAATFVPDQLGRWQYQVHGWLDHLGTWRHGMELKLAAGVDVSVDVLIGVGLIERAIERATPADVAALSRAARAAAGRRHASARPAAGRREPTRRRTHPGSRRRRARARRRRPRRAVLAHRRPGSGRRAEPSCRRRGRRRAGPVQLVVRVLPAVDARTGHRPRHAGRRPRPPRLRRLDGLRRPLPAAGPPDRADPAQGPQQHDDADRRRHGQPVGDRRGRRRAHRRAPRARHRRGRRQAGRRRAATGTSSWRWTSRSSARPTTRGSPSTPSGSPTDPTARSSTPRTRRRSTRTSTRSTSRAPTGRTCGQALADVVRFWIDHGRHGVPRRQPAHQGVRVLGVGDRHDPREHPEAMFLAEAFTRPRVMERLAKVGFNQSYTYFTWRQSAWELRQYFEELSTRTVDYMRPNAWPNTPDILTEQLQTGGPAMFAIRAILAATLSPSWGVYGPAFELRRAPAGAARIEEYLDSEKYQLRQWDLHRARQPGPAARAPQPHPPRAAGARPPAHAALPQHLATTRCCATRRPTPPSTGPPVLVVVNLDARQRQQGFVDVDLAALGLPYESDYEVVDQLQDRRFGWHGRVELRRPRPASRPAAHIFRGRAGMSRGQRAARSSAIADARRRAARLVPRRHHLRAPRPRLRRLQRRRHRRLQRARPPPRLPRRPRRDGDLAAAVLPVAACATTATTSPTTAPSTPTTATCASSGASSTPPTPATSG